LNSDFRPLPLLGNPHLQTLLGNLLPGPELPVSTTIHQLGLPDGDALLLYDSAPSRWQHGRPIAVLVHGLGGNHHSPVVLRMARRLLSRGLRVVRLDLRSCGRGVALARRPYNAGSSADVRAVLAAVAAWSPTSPLVLLGFSLGGNIVLKLAGEAADDPVPNLLRVAAVAPPIDLERCAVLIGHRRNRFYESHFLRELLALVRRRQRSFPDLPRVRFPTPLSLRIYDDRYTARCCGFSSAEDYYQRCSSLPLIPRIAVPTLILTARDDPFIAVEPFEALKVPGQIEVRILDQGGHLGFLGWDGAGGVRWAERRVVEWLNV
jgi:predicted alpha/beta-fold hydrolase